MVEEEEAEPTARAEGGASLSNAPSPDGSDVDGADDGARRVCVTWNGGDGTGPSASSLFGVATPTLAEAGAPLRVLAAREGAAALLLSALGGSPPSPRRFRDCAHSLAWSTTASNS